MKNENNYVKVFGPLAHELEIYLEDRQMEENSPYAIIDFEETERNYGIGKLAGVVEVTLLTLMTVGVDIIKSLFTDYITDIISTKKNYSAVYKLKNDAGEELSITMDKLALEDIKNMIKEFKGNIVEMSSSNA